MICHKGVRRYRGQYAVKGSRAGVEQKSAILQEKDIQIAGVSEVSKCALVSDPGKNIVCVRNKMSISDKTKATKL